MTTDEFIKLSRYKYGNAFDYSKTIYVNKRTKVDIICKLHGLFSTFPTTHIKGNGGCKCCSGRKDITTELFIKESNIIHNNYYDYKDVVYVNNYTSVAIYCPEHGLFYQKPKNHLKGMGCQYCSKRKMNTTSFIQQATVKHKNIYDYSLVKYKSSQETVDIICPKHGIFRQTPEHHLKGCGCPKCAIEQKAKERTYTTKEFIEKANIIFDNLYNYSKVDYIDSTTPVDIICKEHGLFLQTPASHLQGHGCPYCKASKGSLLIKSYLESLNVNVQFEQTLHYSNNRWGYADFITNKGIIEFDGEQHFVLNRYFGDKLALIDTHKRDIMKNNYCRKNGIPLLRIRYDQIDKYKEMIDDFINNNSKYINRFNTYLSDDSYFNIGELSNLMKGTV